ncbi:glycoside hydrolase, partial [Clostridium botulinum]
KAGYLIGTYDSYHSIHKPGEEQWITAKFNDKSLFEEATVAKKDGKKIEGFQGVGRKLNSTLAMPSVKERVTSILNTGLQFNSWFLDTDGTGEIFDDYSPNHITTEEEDIKARLERMDYLQKEYNMVVGTEGGNDFASKNIAFAHGIETPSFSWMDEDMNKNKDSEYYVGRYYSNTNGVPE